MTHADAVAIERSVELAEQTRRSLLAEDLERLRRDLQERAAEEGAA